MSAHPEHSSKQITFHLNIQEMLVSDQKLLIHYTEVKSKMILKRFFSVLHAHSPLCLTHLTLSVCLVLEFVLEPGNAAIKTRQKSFI